MVSLYIESDVCGGNKEEELIEVPDLIQEEDTVLHGICLAENDLGKISTLILPVPITPNKLLGIRYTYRVLRL